MRAVVVRPPSPGAAMEEVPDPLPGAGEVSVEVIECGICGTDRDIVAGQYGAPPAGRDRLILGHENLGAIRELGECTEGPRPGDWVVATVRRSCEICRFCLAGRSDFCESGLYTERGIRGRDGYLAERYVERPEYLVWVPERLRSLAVLLEPLSVVEKAVRMGEEVLGRRGRPSESVPAVEARALITGTGPIGMLAAFLLRSRGYHVVTIDRHGDETVAARLLHEIGVRHVNAAAGVAALGTDRFDLVIEASGSAPLDFDLVHLLGPNGVLVLTGIPRADAPPFPVSGGALLRTVVLENQAIVGSVNANRSYFEAGILDLDRFRKLFGSRVERLITERRGWTDFSTVLSAPASDQIKSVLTVRPGGALGA